MFITKNFRIFLVFISIIFNACEKNINQPLKIDLGDGNFLLPGGKNIYGCTEYRLMNEDGLPTAQMLYYVDKNGDYSGSYDKDNCI